VDDAIGLVEVNTAAAEKGEEAAAPSGSETMACVTSGRSGNSGDPGLSFREESMPDNRTKGGRQTRARESDQLIVPEKAGNAAGGKELTDGRAE
jgi:hypothetical protein